MRGGTTHETLRLRAGSRARPGKNSLAHAIRGEHRHVRGADGRRLRRQSPDVRLTESELGGSRFKDQAQLLAPKGVPEDHFHEG